MLITSSYAWLFLLAICCCNCMALKGTDKLRAAVRSSHSKEALLHSGESESNSKEALVDSKEIGSNSKEAGSGSKEASSTSKEASSNSKEHSSENKIPSCNDKKKNQDETDVDCGGVRCMKCADKKKCRVDDDCISDYCKDKKCTKSTKPTQEITKTTTMTITTTAQTTTTTPESTTTTETTTTTPEPTTTTTESTTTTPEPTTTTTTETTTTTPEPTTTTTETTTTTPEPTTTTTESTTTTPEPTTTTTTETTTTTPESTTTVGITAFNCNPECQNNGMCTGTNTCTCAEGFSGTICEVQSVGLCLADETFDSDPILLITFGDGAAQYSNATPANFDFQTTYKQQFGTKTNDGMFSFVNAIPNDFNHAWHTNATDHTGDDGGYMFLVNADFKPGQFYNGRVNDLCVGLRYEFSVYLANICKPVKKINPNVLFEVRSVGDNTLLAQLNSSDVVEHSKLTWQKYGVSFIAPESSVNLLMISNARGGSGNDLVIDDIALRVCAHGGNGFCPTK